MTVPERAWFSALPKAEVHVHLEGCIPWSLLDRVAERVGLEAPTDRNGASNLAELLVLLDRSCSLLTEPQDIEELAYRAGTRAAEGGALWTDYILNPTHWPAWQGRLPVLVEALDRGFLAVEGEGRAGFGLCLSLKRTQTREEALGFVEEIVALDHPRIVALSIDGNEAVEGRSGERFAPAFHRAADAGLHRCVHAGESSGPEGVRDAIRLLLAERIDHGVRAIEDATLVAELAQSGLPLGICPTSNVRLGVAPSIEDHPVDRLRRAGVRVSINTDDPVLFGSDPATEYHSTATAFGWSCDEVRRVALNSIQASFAPPDVKARIRGQLDRYPDPN